jgi:protein-disulfide isomerase
LYYSWIIRKRFDNTELIEGLKLDVKFLWKLRKKVLSVFLPALGFCLILLIFFPSYWNFSSTLLPKDMLDGITKEGYPWIGASNPELEIMEFTDYQCFQCKKMHFFLRQLIAKHPGKIRLIHRHFPMDHKLNPIIKDRFHVGSSTMALFSTYAQTQDKFWEMNDVLYSMAGKKKVINIKDLAEKIGLNYRALFYSTKDRGIRYKVKHDISTGIKLGINGTPAYVINNKVYFANIPQQILKKFLEY